MPDKPIKQTPKRTEVVKPEKPYAKRMWKGVVETYECLICHTYLNDESDMILHVTGHVPPAMQEQALESLIEEQKNMKQDEGVNQ